MQSTAPRIVLVTGGMGGLGTAIGQKLAREGHSVVANCLPAYSQKDTWLREQQGLGWNFIAAEGDVADYDSCRDMVAMIEKEVGAIEVLVNNAGITRDKLFTNMERAQWDAVVATNLTSLFNVTGAVAAGMAERGWGRIINISSVNGIRGQAGQTNYAAAKAGCLGFTKSLALELAEKGVTVNAIAPGMIATDMVMALSEEKRQALLNVIPMKRAGKPEEVAALVAFLASDLAGYITGATISINGGLHMH
jgi:acetoacetyl-CoA reductase